jgi:hypothetical protein
LIAETNMTKPQPTTDAFSLFSILAHMKFISTLLLAFVVAFTPGCSKPKQSPVIWEYKTVVLSDDTNGGRRIAATLNEMAAQGWEVQGFFPYPGNPTVEMKFILKRPKADLSLSTSSHESEDKR